MWFRACFLCPTADNTFSGLGIEEAEKSSFWLQTFSKHVSLVLWGRHSSCGHLTYLRTAFFIEKSCTITFGWRENILDVLSLKEVWRVSINSCFSGENLRLNSKIYFIFILNWGKKKKQTYMKLKES